MITVKCQHSGLEFEAKSKRSKQHPVVADFKNKACRDNNYREAKAALDEATAIGGYRTIEEYMMLANDIMSSAVAKKNQRISQQRQEAVEAKKAAAERREQRKRTNAFLREHGYYWIKDDDDGYQPMFNDNNWHLLSPDNYEVTVAEALAEIERGVDVVIAERAAAEQARQEAEQRQKEAEEVERQAYKESRASVVDDAIETEAFDYSDFDLIYQREYGVFTDKIFIGKINGVQCGVTYHYFGGHDYYESIRYWSQNPEAAGLTRKERDAMSQRFADIFGA